MQNLLFPFLIVGLDKYLQQAETYPYPAELQHAMNILASNMKQAFPKTFGDLLVLLEQPIGEWHDADDLPSTLDARFSIFDGHELHPLAEEYLLSEDLRGIIDVEALVSHQENSLMAELWKQAHLAYENAGTDEEAFQVEKVYERVRSFLVRKGFTSAREIRANIDFDSQDHVRKMYMVVSDISEQFLHSDSTGEQACWNCSECGPLYVRDGHLTSIKPADCNSKCPGQNGWNQIPFSGDLLVQRRGIHRRTLIPGIPENRLFQWLQQRQAEHPDILTEVRLYPGADAYDIRVVFSSGDDHQIWAVDVKDYGDPNALAFHLGGTSFYDGKDPLLVYDHACYVVPDYRVEDNPRYVDDLRRLVPSGTFYSIEEFRTLVKDKIWRVLP